MTDIADTLKNEKTNNQFYELIPCEDITPDFLAEKGYESYLINLPQKQFEDQYKRVLTMSNQIKDDRGCSSLTRKNEWQVGLLSKLFDHAPQKDMGEFFLRYGEEIYQIYCTFNCPNPCQKGPKNANLLLPLYRNALVKREIIKEEQDKKLPVIYSQAS